MAHPPFRMKPGARSARLAGLQVESVAGCPDILTNSRARTRVANGSLAGHITIQQLHPTRMMPQGSPSARITSGIAAEAMHTAYAACRSILVVE